MGRTKNKGVYLSYILRHKPEDAKIKLDEHGWANVGQLLSNTRITMDELEIIVATDNKQRFSFSEDKQLIRANQGHSIKIDMGFIEKKPPEVLYHGTATRFLDSIMRDGIQKRSRQYVHLSSDKNTATLVGSRHGEPVVLSINTEKMIEEGYKFFLSENNVWLVDHVPVNCIIK